VTLKHLLDSPLMCSLSIIESVVVFLVTSIASSVGQFLKHFNGLSIVAKAMDLGGGQLS
jgi:hypothetical protein